MRPVLTGGHLTTQMSQLTVGHKGGRGGGHDSGHTDHDSDEGDDHGSSGHSSGRKGYGSRGGGSSHDIARGGGKAVESRIFSGRRPVWARKEYHE